MEMLSSLHESHAFAMMEEECIFLIETGSEKII